jgi:hypothetical protein
MTLFDYMKTPKYINYIRNREIYEERSAGIFRATVNSRIKLELMGSGAIVQNDTVLSGVSGGSGVYSNIGDLIVPSNLLSAITSTYISYATNGRVLFGQKDKEKEENEYMLQKVKTAIKEQSIGGSCLLKVVEKDGQPYINIFNVISYFAVEDEDVQDLNSAYVIFNLVEEEDNKETYLLERHEDKLVTYRYITKITEEDGVTVKYIDCIIEGLTEAEDENGIKYSFEQLEKPVVSEVTNLVFSGESDYTDDNIALLREIVVTNTINSQTFDKISNPLLALPEESLEYDEQGNAKVNLTDRVVIIRNTEGGGSAKPEQISLESRIEQSDQHRTNLEGQIFSSLAVNTIALGISGDSGSISGIAIERMLSNTSARVEEKRKNVAKAFDKLADVVIDFSDPIGEDFKEEVTTTKTAVDGGFMSIKQACIEIGNEEDYAQIIKENKALLTGDYEGFNTDESEGK